MHLNRSRSLFVAAALSAAAALTTLGGCGERTPAPTFSYTLLDGKQADSTSLRGKVVLINFWATSCTTCVHEMPQMVATQRKFAGKGFETLAVAMSYDAPASVADFAESRRLPFGVVIDNTGEIASRFGDVRYTPTTVLIDKHGAIVKRYVGEPDFDALHELIGQLLVEA